MSPSVGETRPARRRIRKRRAGRWVVAAHTADWVGQSTLPLPGTPGEASKHRFALHMHFGTNMRVQLTKRLVTGAKAMPKPYEIRDSVIKGLLLRVSPSGHKAWVVEWARARRRTLGALSELSLDEARSAAATVMAEAFKSGEPTMAAPRLSDPTLQEFLLGDYGAWVVEHLRWGRASIKRIEHAFGQMLGKRLSDLDQLTIDRWWTHRVTMTSERSGKLISRATASRELASLRAALAKAFEWKLVSLEPAAIVRVKSVAAEKVVRYMTPEEEASLRATLRSRDARWITSQLRRSPSRSAPPRKGGFGDHVTPVILLAMNTGLRRGELLKLSWSDVDLNAGSLTVRAANAKSGRARFVPLNSEARWVLAEWKAQTIPGDRVFPVKDIKTAWGNAVRQAGIRNLRFHDLRHHFASRLVMNAVDLNTVRELLGHADLKMTLRYAHLAPEHLAAAVETVGRTRRRLPG